MIQMHRPVVDDHGLFAEHDMPCAVCWSSSAVLNMNEGIFQPCWDCQSKGWTLKKKRRRRARRG